MSVRSFHSVFMASAVAGAALSCYLVSLRVASERAALEEVETQIVLAQRDIRMLQTEIGTRGRLAQLERWNVRALALSAPSADQILADKFQLAQMIAPERKLDIDAPVVLAAAPAPETEETFATAAADEQPTDRSDLLQQASLKTPEPRLQAVKSEPRPAAAAPAKAASKPSATTVATAIKADKNKAGENRSKARSDAMTKPVRTAKVDPLAPLPAGPSKAKASRTDQ